MTPTLTDKEILTMRWLARDLNNNEIARVMGDVAPTTVRTYVRKLCKKHGVYTREALVLLAKGKA